MSDAPKPAEVGAEKKEGDKSAPAPAAAAPAAAAPKAPGAEGDDDDEDDEDYTEDFRAETLSQLPEDVKALVLDAEAIQVEFDEAYKGLIKERTELERKYEGIYKVIFDKRAATITGASKGVAGGIPKFWAQALQMNEDIGNYIEEHDVPLLEAITDISTSQLEDGEGFRVTFTFAPNDYINNVTLTKDVHTENEFGGFPIGCTEGEIIHMPGCTIEWKAGKNLTQKIIKKSVVKKGKKIAVNKTEPQQSFFLFFDTPDMADSDEDEDKEEEEEEDEDEAPSPAKQKKMEEQALLQASIQRDQLISMLIHEKIVPRAVDWYTGKAIEDEPEEDDDDEEDEEDEDDDEDADEDEEAEEEEEEDEPKPKKGGKGGKGGKKGGVAIDEKAISEAFAKGLGGLGKDGAPPDCKPQ